MFRFITNNKAFTKIAGINLFSKVGDRLFYTTMLSTASLLPQANIAIMIVSISETMPILLSFILGSLADRRYNKSNLLVKNAAFRVILYLIIGALFHYQLSLFLIVIVAVLNFLSEVAGNYSSALVTPFTKLLVNSKDMEQAQGIISITSQLINVLATFVGSILLTIFLAKTVAFINALVFLIVLLGYWIIRHILADNEKNIKITNDQVAIIPIIKNNFKSLIQNKIILNDLCQLSLLNGVFGGLTPIFVLFLQHSPIDYKLSRPILISILSATITLFIIVGNSLSPKLLQNTPTSKLNNLANYFVIVIGLGLIFNSLTIILIATSLTAFFLGMVSPRFTAKIIKSYPTENLGGIVTTVNSLLVIMPPLTSLLFPLLATMGLAFTYFCFVFYGISLVIMSLIILKTKDKSTKVN